MQASLRHQCGTHRTAATRSVRRLVVRAASSIDSYPTLDRNALKGFKVLVAGSTGGVGKRVVEVLVEQGVSVRALARDPAKAKALLPISSGLVEVVKGDVNQYATLPGALGDANAIICTTGSSDITDPFGSYNLSQGTSNLVALGVLKKLKKFVLVTSIGTDDILNPLNLFWGVLFWKKREEEAVQRSGLDYTIVRPGGLKNDLPSGQITPNNLVMRGPGYFGVPPRGQAGDILRRQVAEVCVAALTEKAASGKVVEIIAEKTAPVTPYSELFERVVL